MPLTLLLTLLGATHSTSDRVVLKSWASSTGETVDLLVKPCIKEKKGARCKIALEVLGPAQRGKFSNHVDLFELEVHGKSYDAAPVDGGTMLSSDYEYGSMHVAVSTGKLGSGVDLILVHRLAGFDHLYDAFFAFTQRGSKLQQVWSMESAMPRDAGINSAEIRDLNGDGVVELLSETVLTYELEGDKGSEGWSGSVHTWRTGQGFKKIPMPVYATIAGSYRTTAEAVKARQANDCLSDYLVLDSSAHPKLEPGWKIVAKMSWLMSEATARAESAKRDCKIEPYVRQAR